MPKKKVRVLEPIPNYGDLMTYPEFLENCQSESFIDYDGFGYYATATGMDDDKKIYPSKALKTPPPAWVTHVVWFNR